jgi:hypothetical protein
MVANNHKEHMVDHIHLNNNNNTFLFKDY